MDTNAAQALKMAGGILIAVVIIATLVYFFRSLAPFQQQIDDIEALEQTADFNKEYEVYNKNLMYGLDIISVLNKAASNNKAYIDTYGNFDDLKENYLIDIILYGKNGSNIVMTQTLDLRRNTMNNQGKVIESSINVDDLRPESKNEIQTKLGLSELRDAWEDSKAKTINNGTHLLVNEASNNYTNRVINDYIIKNSSSDLRKIIQNTNKDTKEDWSRAILETFAYNFKTKKFKCTGVKNSTTTGRVIEMSFKEI